MVTGAARGLGLSFASVLARAGCNVAALDILDAPGEELKDLESTCGVKVKYYACDINCKKQVTSVIEQVDQDFGRIDINVNAAGIVTDEPFLSTSEATLNRTFSVNINGCFFVAQACANSMIKRVKSSYQQMPVDPAGEGGSIVFISSISTHIPSTAQNISAYVSSKAAVQGLAKPLAVELAPFGIRVNSLSPGYMMTDMMRGLQEKQPSLVQQFQKETLLAGGRRIGKPEELHGALLLLCSRKAGGWMTGQDLLVDGGAASWKHPAVLDNQS